MSVEHPIVAITGSSGSGSSPVTIAFEHIFRRERIKAIYIQGSAFHRYDREQMQAELRKTLKEGGSLSHYGPEGNHLDKLESLFIQYAATGTGMCRYYLHTKEFADKWGQEPGTFTPWKEHKKKSDLLLYRGLHGAVIADDIDIAQYPDLIIGIVPDVNLEWASKISRDTALRDYTQEEVRQSILDRMHDYVHHIVPQFSRTHINFQMVPVVDTSDPFTLKRPPTLNECRLVIHFQKCEHPDFVELLALLPESYMSRADTIVVPGEKIIQAIEVVMMPLIQDLVEKSRDYGNKRKQPKKSKSGLIGLLGQSRM